MTDLEKNSQNPFEPRETFSPIAPEVDSAAESLADALRVSFRLLGVIMILVLIAFLFTGLESIEPQEVGIVKVLGKRIGVKPPGIVYNWPFPIGEIEIVRVQEETIPIDDFWMRETPADKTKPLLSRAARAGGLLPRWDGALMTGDRNLFHVQLSCIYRISDPEAYRAGVADSPGSKDQLTRAVRSAVCYAAIQAAAIRTVDDIKTDKESFLTDVRIKAQKHLAAMLGYENAIVPGVTITKVLMGNKTEPLRALKAYEAADQARMASDGLQKTAKAEAESILNASAGPGYRALVGDPLFIGVEEPRGDQTRGETHSHTDDYDLIAQYDAARQAGETEVADELLKHIDEVLTSNFVSGQASRVLSQARADKTDIIESAKSRYRLFAELLPEFEKNPEFLMERLWASTREEILESPLAEKVYLETSSTAKTTIRINQPPSHARAIKREILKQDKAAEAARKAAIAPPPPRRSGGPPAAAGGHGAH